MHSSRSTRVVAAIAGLADALHVGVTRQELAEPGPNDRMVITDHDFQFAV